MSTYGEVMVIERASVVIEATRALGPDQLAARGVGILIEPFVEDRTSTGDSSTTDTNLRAIAPPPPPGRLAPSARIAWIPRTLNIIRMGRDKECEVVLPHPQISKRHALVQRQFGKSAEWRITDEGSTNGTLVNGEPLRDGDRPRELQSGDRISLGKAVVLRPFFDAAALHELLRAADADWIPPHLAHRETLERLASTFRSLGLDVTVEEGTVEVASLTDATRVRLTVEPGAFVVQTMRDGVALERKTVSPHDTKAEDVVRALILAGTQFGG